MFTGRVVRSGVCVVDDVTTNSKSFETANYIQMLPLAFRKLFVFQTIIIAKIRVCLAFHDTAILFSSSEMSSVCLLGSVSLGVVRFRSHSV